MSLLPPSLLDALAGKIVRYIGPTLQSSLASLSREQGFSRVGSIVGSLTGKQSGSSEVETIIASLRKLLSENQKSNPQTADKPQSSGRAYQQRESTDSREPEVVRSKPTATARQQSPMRKLSANDTNVLVKQAKQATMPEQSKSLWQRGWERLTGKKSEATQRAYRLTMKAQRRYDAANRAVKASNAAKGQPGWSDAAHGKLLATRRQAKQRLGQAALLQAKATGLGAQATGKLANVMSGLASKIPMLATRLALPVAVASAVIRAPFELAKLNDSRIEQMRAFSRYNGQIAGTLAKYDLQTENLKAISAEKTAGSTEFLTQQQMQLRKDLRPLQDLGTNLWNRVQGAATWAVGNQIKQNQTQLDILQGFGQEFADLWQGKGFNPGDIPGNVANIRKQREAEDAANAKKFSQQVTQTFGAWVTGIDPNIKPNARVNNQVKPPLQPIK